MSATPSIITDAERLLRLIVETSDEAGAIEIGTGRTRLDANGNPTDDIEMLCWRRDMTPAERAATPHKRTFVYVDAAQPETILGALQLARRYRDTYGNVYLSRCLFRPNDKGKYQRDERFAIPNKLVFVDDVKPEHKDDFAVYIQTSATKGHAYKLTDQSLNAVQYDDVARRLAAYYGADRSGVDYVQLGRWPNTTNTKNHAGTEGYRVRMMRYAPEQVESLEALRAAYPAPAGGRGSTHAPRPTGAAPGDWRNLPDGAALIASGRWQWMYRNRPQLKMLFVTCERVVTFRNDGTVDTTDSAQRAALVSNLLQLHRPPPHSEIRAAALAVQSRIGVGLTDSEYRAAIDREIVTYEAVHWTNKGKTYQPTPTTGIPTAPQPTRGRGRPYAGNQTRVAQLDRLRSILHALPANDYGVITPNASAIAAELGKSARMVRNYLHDLAGQKEINFVANGHGNQLAIILTNRFGTPNQPESQKEIKSAPEAAIEAPVLPAAMLETPSPTPAPLESTGEYNQGVYVLPQVRADVSDFRPTPETPPPHSLAFAVRLAYEAVYVDHETGERRRVTRKRLVAELAEYGDWPEAEVNAAIAEERQRRRIAAIVADIRSMKPPTLRAQLRLMERLSDKSRMEETNLHKFTDWAARELRNALARLPKTGQKPRPICEALPDLRAAGAAHRAQIEQQELVELWSVADRELTRRTPTTPRQRVQPTPQPAAPAGITARLHALKAQREAQQVAQ